MINSLAVKLIHHCIIPGDHQTASKMFKVDQRQITLIVKLWEGEFSELWRGWWDGSKSKQVSVITCKPQMEAQSKFVSLASLLTKLHHPRLFELYAVYTENEPLCIITEPIMYASLLNYLHENANTPTLNLFYMSEQVVEGMAYLEEQNIIHRDLAARNICIKLDDLKNFSCKVANFERARILQEDTFEAHDERLTTYKWTAPEAVIQNRYSIKSDVWSFGIVLYEIVTHGRSPYPGMTDNEVLQQLKSDYRMPRPSECPERLYDIMFGCWRQEPENRPTFKTLQWELYRFLIATDPNRLVYQGLEEKF